MFHFQREIHKYWNYKKHVAEMDWKLNFWTKRFKLSIEKVLNFVKKYCVAAVSAA